MPSLLLADDYLKSIPAPASAANPIGSRPPPSGGDLREPKAKPEPGQPPQREPDSAPPATAAIWLDARDPFSLVVYWDVSEAELAAFSAQDPGGSWRLRVFVDHAQGPLMADQPLPTSRNRRVPVLFANTGYVAALGFLSTEGQWCPIACSARTQTPADSFSPVWTDRREQFVSLPPVRRNPAVATTVPEETTAVASDPIPASGEPAVSDESAAVLTRIVWEPDATLPTGGSAEVAQWVARVVSIAPPPANTPSHNPASVDLATPSGAAVPTPPNPASADTPVLAPPPPQFWFNINTELIVYGRTEPDALVTVAGRPITLRPDGSFSFRFSLPDGKFELPAVAINAARTDQRTAHLSFQRATWFIGDVGRHPQDPGLHPPGAEAVE